MALELKFYKSDNTPWGFRLTGGADCDFPLTVVKVTEDGIAEEAGLQVEDVIVRINDESTSGLTHMEAHDVIARAGNCFIMTVRRDYYTSENFHDDEICDIMERNLVNGDSSDSDINILSTHETTNPEENILQTPNSDVIEEKIAEAISGETELLPNQNVLGVNFNKIDLSQSTVCKAIADESAQAKIDMANKKWSTFLQRPERPVVVPKSNDDIPKAPPYKPNIKRQKKVEIETPSAIEPPAQVRSPEPYELYEEEEANRENTEEIANETEEIDPDSLNEDEITSVKEYNEEDNSEEAEDEDQLEIVQEEEEEEEKEEVKAPLTLEEQLALVEKQLKALAQLPSEVQVGLEAVTKQLAQIVRAHKDVDEEENSQSGESQIEVSQQAIYDENGESTVMSDSENDFSGDEANVQDERCSSSQSSECEYDENSTVQSHISVIDNRAESEEESEVDLEAQQLEEEKLLHQERKNVQLEESHQRRLEQRPTLGLAPIQRPIILPGGRRWSQPDDAVQVPRKCKMTDEKISETLNVYAEVISGRTKGINFLKYQPPPKNLDYLQKSEVFRLIHENDPSDTGIAARSERVASEQDYYNHKTFN